MRASVGQFFLTFRNWFISLIDAVVRNPPANAGDAGDVGLISGLGRFPGGGNGNSL